jgi:phospholipid/cholesterol/gamma-HCH transport system substrate-binding protein
MNERAMQFQIGIFTIVAGLVLTMLIVWFGERPSLLRNQIYSTVHFEQAPGVTVGVPVRKSGIRIGEVTAIEFDHRPNQEGVLVTFSIEESIPAVGSVRARISRSLIGDVSIDLVPSPDAGPFPTSPTPQAALQGTISEGDPPLDPSEALGNATEAIAKVGETLTSIKAAADQIQGVAQKAENLDEFLNTWRDAGKKLDTVAGDLHRVVEANEEDVRPAIANFREVVQKLNNVLDEPTQTEFKTAIQKISSASQRIDSLAQELQPLAQDLGNADVKANPPATGAGQLIARLNRIAFDIGLLTDKLYDPQGGPDRKGGLNTRGSLQRLVVSGEMYENINGFAVAAQEVVNSARPIVRNLREFTEQIAENPSELTRGALRP